MSVDLGFETIGNATCTVFDNSIPVLTTDPWIVGKQYFGSWNHRFRIPKIKNTIVINLNIFGYRMATLITLTLTL